MKLMYYLGPTSGNKKDGSKWYAISVLRLDRYNHIGEKKLFFNSEEKWKKAFESAPEVGTPVDLAMNLDGEPERIIRVERPSLKFE